MSNQPPKALPAAPPAPETTRTRVQLDVPPDVLLLLDNAADVLGQSRSALVLQALLDALPALVERAAAVRRLARDLKQQQSGKR